MSRQVEDEERRESGREQDVAEGTQKRSDWPRSARQLGQRIPKIKKLGTLHQLPRTIYKGRKFRV
jgi:hypothetical protein